MLHVICGLMGSGKSTYARKHYRKVLEFERFRAKDLQISKAQELLDKGEDIAYVTCYPTSEEREFFGSLPKCSVEYILIDTDIRQARQNIIKRGRKSDHDVLETRFETNKKLARLIAGSSIPFHRVEIFRTNERW